MFDLLNLASNRWRGEAAQSQGCVSPSPLCLVWIGSPGALLTDGDSEPRVRVHRPSCGEASCLCSLGGSAVMFLPVSPLNSQEAGTSSISGFPGEASVSASVSFPTKMYSLQVSKKMAHIMILLSLWAYMCLFSCDH